jgi:hypothetical protein
MRPTQGLKVAGKLKMSLVFGFDYITASIHNTGSSFINGFFLQAESQAKS